MSPLQPPHVDRVDRGSLRVRGPRLRWGVRTYVMGIVNVTPDSFSGDGRVGTDDALAHAIAQAGKGCDIVDVGGESTRPGHTPIGEEREAARVVPVVRRLRERCAQLPISIDTYKPAVARAAVAAGADAVNSVWGLPETLLDVVVECGVPVIVMHNQSESTYDGNVVDTVLRFLNEAAERAVHRGVPEESVVLDPGIGFGKNAEQNIAVLRALPRLVALGFPTLLGTSRKSTIGKLTGRDTEHRVHGTAATTALAAAAGIDAVRVHDVAETRDVLAVADAMVRDWRPDGWTG